MAQTYGYAGQILKIDLSSRTSETVPSEPYTRFIGGRGFAARLYWEEVPPEAGALSEQNRLIFAVGPLAGVPVIGGSRWGIYGKSPIPSPQTFSYSNLGGTWGAEKGELVFMIGGEESTVKRVEPALGAMGKRWFHIGAHGAGQTMKLATNMILAMEIEA